MLGVLQYKIPVALALQLFEQKELAERASRRSGEMGEWEL
jgi:hypothetical protein